MPSIIDKLLCFKKVCNIERLIKIALLKVIKMFGCD